MRLWYRNPAEKWREALPVGNGSLGGMVYGRPFHEVIQLNEETIWSSKSRNRINQDALKNLKKIRKLIHEKNIEEAEKMALLALSGVPYSQGSYQTAGELYLDALSGREYSEYERELDLENAVVRTRYRCGDTVYTREVISSYPDQIMAIHLTAEGKEKLNFSCALGRCDMQTGKSGGEENRRIFFLADTGGMKFCVMAECGECDGTAETIGDHLLVRDASEVTLYLSINSTYRCEKVQKECREKLQKAEEKGWKEILSIHIRDYRKLYQGMELKLGNTDRRELPVDERLELLRNGGQDEGLYALYVQYGRYLLISSSRPGSLPCNLQGIWNCELTPPWGSKYTININTEMNYWPAESTGLSECQLPYFDLLDKMKENGKKTAKEMYGCRGSVAHHNTDIYGDTAPQDKYIPASYWVMGEAWMATHIIEHYEYTGDMEFLKKYFDVYEQCVLFFEDFLVEREDGTLVTSPSVSPENTYIMENGKKGCLCEGSFMDIEILRELFRGYLKSCEILGEKEEKKRTARKILERLPQFQIGKNGQLQEWQEDYEEAEPGHRHISHLFGIYPGTSLYEGTDTKYRDGARISLERRLAFGSGHTGWSRAWIMGLWARFQESEKAYENFRELLKRSTFPNLMNNHPLGNDYVFQIDGNMGAAAAVMEMLVQFQNGILYFLPSLPEVWKEGSIKGMCLKEGILLDMEWKNGRVTSLSMISDSDQEMIVCFNDRKETFGLKKGIPCIWKKQENL